ncbi:MAG TPA: LLM class flavin-dependent oxidoreductase [Thermomicrobiaceae bacterium]|nr:LLM class flavin-dependent oxidoreductase [Thermomicrobiaceae bacterium]
MSARLDLKLGLILPEGERDMDGRTASWSDYTAMARTAEEMGFDSLWFVDHLLYREGASVEPPQGVWECWSVLAALAAVTSRVELAPLVSCTGYRNPALLAKIADTVDEIAGGRLLLALGAGWHEPEYGAFGFPFDHRYARFAEALTIIHGLLRDGHVDFAGRYYTARDCELRPRGPRGGTIPIMLGTTGEKMLRLTARYADQWNAWLAMTDSSPERLPDLNAAVDAACAEVGRDPSTLERTIAVMVDVRGNSEIPASMGRGVATPICGAPEAIAATLRRFANHGVRHLQLYLIPNTVETIRAFEPVLRELGRA